MEGLGGQFADAVRQLSGRSPALLTKAEIGVLFRALDSSGFWTDERLETLLDASAKADAGDGSVEVTQFVESLLDKDYASVRADLLRMMDSPDWDDGSYAPLLIRLAWHSSGTYCAEDGTGGSNGATMRHLLEASDPENAGLDQAREYLAPLKEKYPWISYADLWILAAYVAIEHTGGPCIPFKGGRVDAPEEKAVAPGRLPEAEHGLSPDRKVDEEGRIEGWEHLAKHVRDTFARMGLGDREAVALLCGGHVYGRCHPTSSGYVGAWVENPTLFSNEYAADMIGDEWIPVFHDTEMPDGGAIPEEVRPAPGKLQYIDLSKYEPQDGPKPDVEDPDASDYAPGQYECTAEWMNVRASADTRTPIIGRFTEGQTVSVLAVRVMGKAVRGLLERGGWISLRTSGGNEFFERKGDLDPKALAGKYRVTASSCLALESASSELSTGRIDEGEEFHVDKVVIGEGDQQGFVFGHRPDVSGPVAWAQLLAPEEPAAELIVECWNEKPRRPLAGQTTHQMMLVSDMVLRWDPGFLEHLKVYAEDGDQLKKDFGEAFQRLTELGCPWSVDFMPQVCPATGAKTDGASGAACPFLAVSC